MTATRALSQVERESLPPVSASVRSGTYRVPVALDAVPRLAVSPSELRELPLDHRAGFLVWLVDGSSTVDSILDACPIARDHALAMLSVLVAHGVLTLD